MPSTDDYASVLASLPQSSTGVVKEDYGKTTEGGKPDEYAVLKGASGSNPIPVVVVNDPPIAGFIQSEQDTVQVYVIQSELDAAGMVAKVYLARNDSNGVLTGVVWCPVMSEDSKDGKKVYIICGKLADAEVEVSGKAPVGTEPEVVVTTAVEQDNRPLESFIFFDPFADDEKDYKKDSSPLDRALGMQRDVARFMGLCGSGRVSRSQQRKIDQQVHLIPFTDLSGEVLEDYPELKPMAAPGINIDPKEFVIFWNKHVATCKVHVVILQNHASSRALSMNNTNPTPKINDEIIVQLTMPSIDYILLIGCNLGNLSDQKNLAYIFCEHAGRGNPEKVKMSALEYLIGALQQYAMYLTAVVAADGKTSAPVRKDGDYVLGMDNRTGKYDGNKNRIEGKGFCVFRKSLDCVAIPGTAADPPDEEEPNNEWTEYPISIEKMLMEARQIVRQ